MVKNQGTKQRERKILRDCWQWKTNGQWFKEDNCFPNRHEWACATDTAPILLRHLLRGRMREMHREPEILEAETQVEDCFDDHTRITSKRTSTNSFCDTYHPPKCLFCKTKSGSRFGKKCSCAHRQVDEQPYSEVQKEWWQKCSGHVEREWFSRKHMATLLSTVTKVTRDQGYPTRVETKTCWTSSNARHFGLCLSRNGTAETVVNPQTRKIQSNVWYSRKRLHVRQKNRDENLSFGLISCPSEPQRSSKIWASVSGRDKVTRAMCPWSSVEAFQKCMKFKRENKTTFFSPSENWRLLASSNLEPEDKEFVVDFGVSMHMMNTKDLNSDVLETVTKSFSHTIVATTNKEVQTHEKITSLSWICSWLWKSSKTRQQFYRSESFAMNTDTLTNGSTVKKHIS